MEYEDNAGQTQLKQTQYEEHHNIRRLMNFEQDNGR